SRRPPGPRPSDRTAPAAPVGLGRPRVARMSRENFLSDEPWTDAYGDAAIRSRVFERHLGAMLGASLHELAPGAPGFKLHMHYGAEEIFFVVSGSPTLRTGRTE